MKNNLPLPDLEWFCEKGIADGIKNGKPPNIADSKEDLIWEAGKKARDGVNYCAGKEDQIDNPGSEVKQHVIMAELCFAAAYNHLLIARELELIGEE